MGDKEGLKDLLAYVNMKRGIDFALYRHATIVRKLDLRLRETGTAAYGAYIDYLRSNPAELEQLVAALTIRVTSFFRNPLVFELLSSRVLPELMSRFLSLRMWSLGCATGEEPYSLAIIISDLLQREKKTMDVEVVGTDIDANAIEKAMRGEYRPSGIGEIRKRYVDEFFRVAREPASGNYMYRISDQIKSVVRFERDDIISRLRRAKDSGRPHHIILCRNLLIYMNRELRKEILANIYRSLCAGGYLVIGESEVFPDTLQDRFTQVFPGVKIFCRKPDD